MQTAPCRGLPRKYKKCAVKQRERPADPSVVVRAGSKARTERRPGVAPSVGGERVGCATFIACPGRMINQRSARSFSYATGAAEDGLQPARSDVHGTTQPPAAVLFVELLLPPLHVAGLTNKAPFDIVVALVVTSKAHERVVHPLLALCA